MWSGNVCRGQQQKVAGVQPDDKYELDKDRKDEDGLG